MIEAPQQRSQRARLRDAGLPTQGAGGLAGGGGADHLIPGRLEGVPGAVERGGLARAGHAEHQ